MRLDALAPIIPDTITSLIRTLTRRFTGDFNGTLALTGAFRAFSIVEAFFFNVVLIDFAYAVNDFFVTGLVFLRSLTN
jgi:hypothetical protein